MLTIVGKELMYDAEVTIKRNMVHFKNAPVVDETMRTHDEWKIGGDARAAAKPTRMSIDDETKHEAEIRALGIRNVSKRISKEKKKSPGVVGETIATKFYDASFATHVGESIANKQMRSSDGKKSTAERFGWKRNVRMKTTHDDAQTDDRFSSEADEFGDGRMWDMDIDDGHNDHAIVYNHGDNQVAMQLRRRKRALTNVQCAHTLV